MIECAAAEKDLELLLARAQTNQRMMRKLTDSIGSYITSNVLAQPRTRSSVSTRIRIG